jgi:hypothetical protein
MAMNTLKIQLGKFIVTNASLFQEIEKCLISPDRFTSICASLFAQVKP